MIKIGDVFYNDQGERFSVRTSAAMDTNHGLSEFFELERIPEPFSNPFEPAHTVSRGDGMKFVRHLGQTIFSTQNLYEASMFQAEFNFKLAFLGKNAPK